MSNSIVTLNREFNLYLLTYSMYPQEQLTAVDTKLVQIFRQLPPYERCLIAANRKFDYPPFLNQEINRSISIITNLFDGVIVFIDVEKYFKSPEDCLNYAAVMVSNTGNLTYELMSCDPADPSKCLEERIINRLYQKWEQDRTADFRLSQFFLKKPASQLGKLFYSVNYKKLTEPVTYPEELNIIEQLGRALLFFQEEGITFMDIVPLNVVYWNGLAIFWNFNNTMQIPRTGGHFNDRTCIEDFDQALADISTISFPQFVSLGDRQVIQRVFETIKIAKKERTKNERLNIFFDYIKKMQSYLFGIFMLSRLSRLHPREFILEGVNGFPIFNWKLIEQRGVPDSILDIIKRMVRSHLKERLELSAAMELFMMAKSRLNSLI